MPSLLYEQEFRRFWIGNTISMFGDQITGLALPVVAVLALGAEATEMGLLVAVGLLPHLLFSLPAGVWLDRVRQRRRLMILMDLGRAAAIVSVPIAYYLNVLSMPLLFAIFFIVGTLSVIFDIAWNTLFVAVAKREQYVEANSLLNGSRSLSSVGGPALAGLLIEVIKAPLALVADALSFVGSAFFLTRIRAPEAPIEHDPGSIRSQLAAGLQFLVRDPIIRPTVLSIATVNLFNYCFEGLFVLYVLKYLLRGAGRARTRARRRRRWLGARRRGLGPDRPAHRHRVGVDRRADRVPGRDHPHPADRPRPADAAHPRAAVPGRVRFGFRRDDPGHQRWLDAHGADAGSDPRSRERRVPVRQHGRPARSARSSAGCSAASSACARRCSS